MVLVHRCMFDFRVVMNLGKTLSLNLLVLVLWCLSEGNRSNRWKPGCELCFTLFFLCQGSGSYMCRSERGEGSRWSSVLCLSLSEVLFVHFSAAGLPHRYAVSQQALNRTAVEGYQQLSIQVGLPEHPQEVQSLLCLLNDCCGVCSPRKVSRDKDTEEFECLDPLHTLTIDVKGGGVYSVLPEIKGDNIGFCGVQCQVVH